MHKTKKKLLFSSALAALILTGCGGGGTGSTTTPAANNGVVQLAGVVVTPNLGVVQNVTVTATDLTTNKQLGITSTADAYGRYIVPNAATKNPIIIKVTGGTYLDEATGTNISLPTSGITACLPDASAAPASGVAVTPITEIATQAALKSGNPTAAVIDAANKNVGSALLNGADPTTTVPVDISKATPAGATPEQKNYARVLAGLAVFAKNSGTDLFASAQTLTGALFDPYGKPALSKGGAIPVSITTLQAEVTNYTPPANLAANTPPADPYAVIGLVTPALSTTPTQYYFMAVDLDPYTTGTGQSVSSVVALGNVTMNFNAGTDTWNTFAVYSNGVASTMQSGSDAISRNTNGQVQIVPKPNPTNQAPETVDFSKDGEFAVLQSIADNSAFKQMHLGLIVRKPTTAPTLASVAGTYHLFLAAHDSSSAPTALPGYTEHGLLTLDGRGGLSYNMSHSVISAQGVSTTLTKNPAPLPYSVDPYAVIIDTSSMGGLTNGGHLIFSANGQYALYEVHAAGNQEWGIAIRDHANNIPFSAMTHAILFDAHSQSLPMGMDFHKGLNYAAISPTPAPVMVNGVTASAHMGPVKEFAPAQFAPQIMCGTATTPACGTGMDIVYQPIAPNTTQAAVNGAFTMADVQDTTLTPFATGFISAQGDVTVVEDYGNALVIGLGR